MTWNGAEYPVPIPHQLAVRAINRFALNKPPVHCFFQRAIGSSHSTLVHIFTGKVSMIHALRLALLLSVCALAVQANPALVKLKVRVILVDRDLNQKPVPFLLVSLKSGAKSSDVKTALDGTVETQLPPGKYMITTPKAAELADRRFSWNMTLAITGAQANVH